MLNYSITDSAKRSNLRFLMLSIFTTLSLLFFTSARGATVGLFLEPGITYELGDTTINYPSPLANSTGSVQGLGLAARAGVHLFEAFFLGLDYRYSMPQFKDSSDNYDEKAIATNWGPVVGMQMPIVGLRIWGSYIMDGELNPDKSRNFDVKFAKATGYRVGAGFQLILVSLNLEYQQLKYDQTNLEQAGPFSANTTLNQVNLENKTWLASVSFPLEF